MRCLFCSFVNREITEHKKGYPFIINHQTKNTLSFLSLDSPINKEAHMLVIPKKHFKNYHDIPSKIKEELALHISKVGEFYSKKGEDYNILLNNGKKAGQFIMHSHFHIIPRKNLDNIKIEVWKRSKITGSEFVKLSNKTKKDFKSLI